MAGKGIQPTGGSSRKSPGRAQPGQTRPGGKPSPTSPRQQAIPEAVANRMARRVAVATGIPTLMGMGVFVASYLLVTRGVMDIPPGATLAASGGCFLLGLLGLSYGVLSASWEPQPGSLLGGEQLGLNISRIKQSIASTRQRREG